MKIIGIFFVLVMLWGGGQGLYTGLRNMEMTKVSCADFLNNRTDKDWLRVEGCFLDYSDVVVLISESSTTTSKNDDFYVPIRSSASSNEVTAFLKIDSEQRKAAFSKVFNLPDDQDIIDQYFDDNPDQLALVSKAGVQNLEGLRLFGIESKDSDRELLSSSATNENFIILDEGEKPETLFSLLMFVIGIGILVSMLETSRRKRKQADDLESKTP